MTKTGLRVGIKTDEGISIHCAAGYGDFDTLCGIDSNDPEIGHLGTVPVTEHAKIECAACKGIFEAASKYKRSDFK